MRAEPIRWLSSAAESLAARTAEPKEDGVWDCDVLIVGSGYGGAVAAQALAGCEIDGRPQTVWVLERGQEFVPGSFPDTLSGVVSNVRFSLQDGRPPRGQAEGLFDVRVGPQMSVLLGNGLGGGSLINSNVMEIPHEEIFQSGWPASITAEAMQPWYERARRALGAVQPSFETARLMPKYRLLEELAGLNEGAEGIRPCHLTVNFAAPEAPPVETQTCTKCGDCLTGCNVGAKRSLDTTLLAEAARRGAVLWCGGVVEWLEPVGLEPKQGWRVWWQLTEPTRRSPDGSLLELRARRVVLAAGSLGSTEILLRSRAASPDLSFSDRLGEGFNGNGDAVVSGRGHPGRVGAVRRETDGRDATDVGPTIVGMATLVDPKSGRRYRVEDFSVPSALRSWFAELTATLEAVRIDRSMRAPDAEPVQVDRFRLTEHAVEHTSLFGVIHRETIYGRLTIPSLPPGATAGSQGCIRIDYGKQSWAMDPTALSIWASFKERLSAAGAQALPPARWVEDGQWLRDLLSSLPFKVPALPSLDSVPDLQVGRLPLCTHPLGGCAMADGAASGVVDACGRVYTGRSDTAVHDGLYVLDGAIVPVGLGVNPALTIAALAMRAVDRWSDDEAGSSAVLPRQTERPRIPVAPAAVPVAATWSIRERQIGTLNHQGRDWQAQLDLKFAPLQRLRARLAGPMPILVPLESAELRLVNGASQIAWSLRGSVRLFKAASAGDEAFQMVYDMRLVGPQQGEPTHIVGTKRILEAYFLTPWRRSPWRELSEIDVEFIDAPGQSHRAGRLHLDMNDLARKEEALLSLQQLSSMPDALDDLLAVVGYVGRRFGRMLIVRWLLARWLHSMGKKNWARPIDRRPGAIGKVWPERETLDSGAVLSRYRPPGGDTVAPPIVLIHGLAMSGNSFTHADTSQLAGTFLKGRREVFVLDLASSSDDDSRLDRADIASWTIESLADDIPHALQRAAQISGAAQVDVFAHCYGGVMFCVAALGRKRRRVARLVRRAVLSQVGPVLQPGAMNRLRAYLTSYIWRHGQFDRFDCVPSVDGTADAIIEALASTFPYPDDDVERRIPRFPRAGDLVRHRADLIFGQLYESKNVAVGTLDRLHELLGSVPARLVAQTIMIARHGLIATADGGSVMLDPTRFKEGMPFPLLFVHGELSKVFRIEGSRENLEQLRKWRGLPPASQPQVVGDLEHHGLEDASTSPGISSVQLLVVRNYGHLDVIIGKSAARDVHPRIQSFLDAPDQTATKVLPAPPPCHAEFAWTGPTLGCISKIHLQCREWLDLDVALTLTARAESRVLAVPWVSDGSTTTILAGQIAGVAQLHGPKPRLRCRIDAQFLRDNGWPRIAIVVLHHSIALKTPFAVFPKGQASAPEWLALRGSSAAKIVAPNLSAPELLLLKDLLSSVADAETASMVLSEQVIQAAERHWPRTPEALAQAQALPGEAPTAEAVLAEQAAKRKRPSQAQTPAHDDPGGTLCFALASCQYPNGPLDRETAQAALARLAADPDPQLLLLAGDQVYVDAAVGLFDPADQPSSNRRLERVDLRQIYERAWRQNAFRRATARLPTIAIVDDHEVRDSFPGVGHRSGANGGVPDQMVLPERVRERWRQVTRASMAAAREHLVEVPWGKSLGGRPRSLSRVIFPARVPMFVLDTRWDRLWRTPMDVAQASILDDAVMGNLIRLLQREQKRRPGWPKFIVSASPLLPVEKFHSDDAAVRIRSDTWSGFPSSAARLMKAIDDEKIDHVILLAGDSHVASVTTWAFEGSGRKVSSVVSSALYAPWPFANASLDSFVLEGPARIGIDGPKGHMTKHATSERPMYAVVKVQRDAQDESRAAVSVSLRSPGAASIDIALPTPWTP